jgi:hypothetical protein
MKSIKRCAGATWLLRILLYHVSFSGKGAFPSDRAAQIKLECDPFYGPKPTPPMAARRFCGVTSVFAQQNLGAGRIYFARASEIKSGEGGVKPP